MNKSTNFRALRGWALGAALAVLGAAGLSAGGCKKDSDAPAVDPNTVANVKLATSATLGAFLTDSVGNTLYFFARDVDGANTCTSAACNPMWPVYYNAALKVPTSLKAADFATKATADGRPQTTYKGWPLYYFAPPTNGVYTREAAGQTNGNGVGGIWHVMSPAYGVVLASKSVEDKTTHVVTTKTFLVDALGRTLYFFAKDRANPNTLPTNCTDGCAAVWPPLYLSTPTVPSTLNASDFATITRDPSSTTGPYGTATSTQLQLTYKGRPLYYYAGDDAVRGHAEGHDFDNSGGLWFVAAP